MTLAPHRFDCAREISCEALIVGSGAGGCAAASVLIERGYDVVMAEEGPATDAAKAPASLPEAIARLWRAGGLLAALGKPPIAYAEGRCVGGGTEINSAIFQRAPDVLLDSWAREFAIGDFGAAALAPYYARAAAMVNASATAKPHGRATDILHEGAAAMGWTSVELERAQRQCVGTNLCAAGCPTGGKQSMTAALIPGLLSKGLRLIAETRVVRLKRRGRRASGALALARGEDGRRHKITISCEHVFVAAGAVHTPLLLMRSGMAGKNRTLKFHPTVRATALFDEEVNAQDSRLPLAAVSAFMPDLRLGGSFFTPGLFAMGLAEDWERRGGLLAGFRHAATYYAMIRPRASGQIAPLFSAEEPLVRYGLDDSDWALLGSGLRRLGRLLFAAGAKRVIPSIAGHPGWSAPSEIAEEGERALPREKTSVMSIHMMSTCPPGENTGLCATDSFGRLRGYDNVTIVDASQIPGAPGVNPQASVMAIALRNAEHFAARGRGA